MNDVLCFLLNLAYLISVNEPSDYVCVLVNTAVAQEWPPASYLLAVRYVNISDSYLLFRV